MEKLSIFNKLPETKLQVEKTAAQIKAAVLNGDVDPLTFAALVSAMEKLFTTLKSDILIKDCVLSAAEKYGAKPFEKGNAIFQIREFGVTYDYSNCNDSELDLLNKQILELTEKKKARETFLKSISFDSEIYGADGIQILPPIKKSSTQVSVTLK